MAKSAKKPVKLQSTKKPAKRRKKPDQLTQVIKLFTNMVKDLRILNRKIDGLTDGVELHREKMTERHKEIRQLLRPSPGGYRPDGLSMGLNAASPPDALDSPGSAVQPPPDQIPPSA